MIFWSLKHFLELIKGFSEKEKHTAWHVVAPESATCPADVSMTSAWGSPNANVIMAFDDVNVDLVNVDQVNGQLGPRLGGAHMSAALGHWPVGPACQV